MRPCGNGEETFDGSSHLARKIGSDHFDRLEKGVSFDAKHFEQHAA